MGNESSREEAEVPTLPMTRRGFLMAFTAGAVAACSSADAETESAAYDAGPEVSEPEVADAGPLPEAEAEAASEPEGDEPEPDTVDAPAFRRRRARREAMESELAGWPGAQPSMVTCSDEFISGTCARNAAGLFAHYYG